MLLGKSFFFFFKEADHLALKNSALSGGIPCEARRVGEANVYEDVDNRMKVQFLSVLAPHETIQGPKLITMHLGSTPCNATASHLRVLSSVSG